MFDFATTGVFDFVVKQPGRKPKQVTVGPTIVINREEQTYRQRIELEKDLIVQFVRRCNPDNSVCNHSSLKAVEDYLARPELFIIYN